MLAFLTPGLRTHLNMLPTAASLPCHPPSLIPGHRPQMVWSQQVNHAYASPSSSSSTIPLSSPPSYTSFASASSSSSESLHSALTYSAGTGASSSCYSASSSQSSFDIPALCSAPPLRVSRPLPIPPRTASLPHMTGGVGASRKSLARRRPLPIPPPPGSASFAASGSGPYSAPPIPLSGHRSASTSPKVRPLPIPSPRLPETHNKAALSSVPLRLSSLSYVRVSIPLTGSGGINTDFVLESPLTPSSPLVFRPAACASESPAPLDEERVAKRLSKMGFVEVARPPSPPLSSSGTHSAVDISPASEDSEHDDTAPARQSQVRQGADTDADTDDGSSSQCHEITITVELLPAADATLGSEAGAKSVGCKRGSRRWIREKKGKRWVEEDYNQILNELRRL